jgi:hypothetical protein
MNRRTFLILAVVTIACIGGFSVLAVLDTPVRHFLLDPMVDGIWAIRRILAYAPQDIEWLVALLFAAAASAIYFASRLPTRSDSAPHHAGPRFSEYGPAMQLERILERSPHRKFSRQKAILELREVTARVLAYRYGSSLDEAKDALDTTEWTSDESVRALLSLEKHRVGERKHRTFHEQVDHALEQIERIVEEV